MRDQKSRLRGYLEAERQKLESLTGRQKLRYIIDYYWLWILGVFGAVFILGYVIYHAAFAVKDFWFYAVFANTMGDGGNGSRLYTDFVDYAGFDTSQKKVEMNASSWFDPSVKGGTVNSYYQAFVALVESGDLDIVVMGKEGLRSVGSSGRLLDLSDEKCAAIYEKYGGRLVTCEPYDEEYSGGPVPVGIDISDSRLVTEYELYEGDCVLGISAYSSRISSVEAFLDFILMEE